MMDYKKEYEGQTYDCVGGRATVLSYYNAKKVLIRFDNGYETVVQMGNLKRGTCDSPLRRSVYGIGYMGDGHYSQKNNPLAHQRWKHMMTRCYNENYLNSKPTYENCSVCEEWHNFQNFAKWFEENYYEVDDTAVEIDKDILIKGNKIYSPDTCCFVPRELNNLFQQKGDDNGLPTGVQRLPNNKYRARYGQIHLGVFDDVTEARQVYEKHRCDRIKYLEIKYRNSLKPEVSRAILERLQEEEGHE